MGIEGGNNKINPALNTQQHESNEVNKKKNKNQIVYNLQDSDDELIFPIDM